MRFALTAVDASKQVVALELDAADETGARDLAKQRGLAVLSLRHRGVGLGWRFGRARFPTTLFSVELLALLDAGLNVVEALQTLAEKEPRGETRGLLDGLLKALRQGESLSQAIARFPQAFSPLYAATVRSSEQTGNLKEALSRYIAYREEFDRVRKKVLSTLLYPAILLIVGALVFGFLMLYVVPRFARVYEEISADLPFFSGLLLGVGRFIEHSRLELGATAAAGVAGIVWLFSKERLRNMILERLWSIPMLGARLKIYHLGRLYRTAGMLLRAGIPVPRALEMTADLLPVAMRAQAAQAIVLLKEGRSISDALTAARLTTPVATRMMAVGEKSGRMGELMDRIARFYDEETARFLDAFTRVFEPLLMAVLGVAVGGIVVLMYMPVFELAGSIR